MVPKSRPRRELMTGPNTAMATVEATTARMRSSSTAAAPASAAAGPDWVPYAISEANAIRLNTSDTLANAAAIMARASLRAGIGSSLK